LVVELHHARVDGVLRRRALRAPGKIRDAAGVVCISDFTRSQLMAFSRQEDWAKLA